MTVTDGSSIAANADPLTGGWIEGTTTGYGHTPTSNTAVDAVAVSVPEVKQPAAGRSVAYALVLLILGMVALKFASEHQKADLDVAHVRISLWNWAAVTLLSLTGIVTGKALLNQWPGPDNPITQVFNAG